MQVFHEYTVVFLLYVSLACEYFFLHWLILDLNVMLPEGYQHPMKDDSAQILLSNKKAGAACLIQTLGC